LALEPSEPWAKPPAKETDRTEVLREQGSQLVPSILAAVEGVVRNGPWRFLLGSREDQPPLWGQHASYLAKELAIVVEVFNGLKRKYRVEARIGERQGPAVHGKKAQVRPPVAMACLIDSLEIPIHTHDQSHSRRQRMAAVASPAGCVEDAHVGDITEILHGPEVGG